MDSIEISFSLDRMRAIFDESTCSDEPPTEEEWEEFVDYFRSDPDSIVNGRVLDFWCQFGH